MSIALRRLSYAVILTPQVKQKKRCLQGAFFAERVAVLRSLTATLDRERNEAFAKWREGIGACNGNRRSEASAEQIINSSPFSGVPIEVDGWR